MENCSTALCRVCNGPPAISLFDNSDGTRLAELMASFANVLLIENDGKPSHICHECAEKLKLVDAFRKQIQEAEKLLEFMADNQQIESKKVKIELVQAAAEVEEEEYEYEYLEEYNNEPNKPDQHDNDEKTGEKPDSKLPTHILCKDEQEIASELSVSMEDEEIEEDKDIVKFPFEMPSEDVIAHRIKFDDFEYLEIDGDRCCGCSFIAANRDQLIHHSKEQHSHNYYPDSSYTCPTCYQKFKTQDKLAKHIEYYSYSDIFLCTVCNESFVHKNHLKTHQASSAAHQTLARSNTVVDTNSTVVRRKVRSKLPRKEGSVQHTKSNSDKLDSNNYCCFVRCWEGFENLDKLMAHVQEAHNGKRRENEISRPCFEHICSICQRSFDNKSKLLLHRTYKQNRQEHICQKCGRCFYKSHALRDHEQREHQQQTPEHKCETCGKAFLKKSVLKHHRKIHDPFESVPCTEPGCEFVFRDKALMKRHCKNVHGNFFPWECQFCPKKVRTKEAMDLHVRVHTGEKPFGCRLGCDRRFAHATDRARHERSRHTGEKPHKCDQCPAAFGRRRELQIHFGKNHGISDN